MADTHHPPFWKEHLLALLGAPQRAQSHRLFDAQSRAEGGTAKWNPLNSTLHLDGFTSATDYNSSGVRNYTAPVAGVCATALTFIGRDSSGKLLFGGILGDLQAGVKTAEQITADRRAEFVRWAGGDTRYPDLILSILRETP